ncbi:MAG: PQQ-binding-like beta-propeller repeat protein [Planctomycetales bacterium]
MPVAGSAYFVGKDAFSVDEGTKIGSLSVNVITQDLFLSASGSSLSAYSRKESLSETVTRDRKGVSIRKVKFQPKRAWEASVAGPVCVVAGGRAYTGGDGKISAVDLNSGKPAWTAEIDGVAWSMLAADDKLFVVTESGAVHCFAAGRSAVEHAYQPRALSVEPNPFAAHAESAIQQSGREGYALALGLGSGQLVEEIVKQSELFVIAVDADQKKVDAFRARMQAAGLYGTRVTAHVDDPIDFALPPYLAHLIVSEDVVALKLNDGGLEKIFPSLRPYGGSACLALSDEQHAALASDFKKLGDLGGEVSRVGSLSVVKRAGALPGSSDWSHQYADAGNSVVSKDKLVKAPLGLLWFGGPPNDKVLPRHGHGPSPQVAGGRLFIEGADMIRSVDVYTGRLLWEADLPGVGSYYDVTSHFPGAGEIGSNYVSLPDSVYVLRGESILRLNAVNGETMREFKLEQGADGSASTWGFLAASGDRLIAASTPVTVGAFASKVSRAPTLKGTQPIIKPNEKWSYLAGGDPPSNWTRPDFDARSWKTGAAGFGYGDGDDRTVLKDMPGKYARVYVRKEFDAAAVKNLKDAALVVNYDDAIIAYLNGTEIVRAGVKSGSGKKASGISSHEANGPAVFPINSFRKLLREGANVLAVEGHNTGLKSSDFTLDPYLVAKPGTAKPEVVKEQPKASSRIDAALAPASYSSASRRLVVMDRRTGEKLWERQAVYNFRHNCILAAGKTIFCIDGMSPTKIATLRRRGVAPDAKPKLLALDAETGEEIWSTEADVFGTFLNYSAQHDVLLQAGSAYRDRARDEIGRGMIAYRGRDGQVLWKDMEISYGGPCMLWRDTIITNGGGGFQLELLTGKPTGWSYRRMYGCNTAVGSEHLLTFRSGAAGFYDLDGDSGTGNIGGFRSSCTANLIPADGVLNAPDYTRTCSCAYQNQTSLALIHVPDAELWTFNAFKEDERLKRKVGVNLGAPGDRRDTSGTLWLDYPSVGGDSPDIPLTVAGENLRYLRRHALQLKTASGDGLNWVAASAAVGIGKATLSDKQGAFTVRLHFAELENLKPGERVFTVAVQGKTVLENFDVAKEAGGSHRAIVKEFRNVVCEGELTVTLTPKTGQPILSGIEVVAEK